MNKDLKVGVSCVGVWGRIRLGRGSSFRCLRSSKAVVWLIGVYERERGVGVGVRGLV